MNYCEKCGVHIATPSEYCPLCGGELAPPVENLQETYPLIGYSRSAVDVIHFAWFAIMAVFVISIIVQLVTAHPVWLLVVTLGSMCAGGALLYSYKVKDNAGFALLKLELIVAAVVVFADHFTGFHRWSVNYVIPFMVMGGALTITLMLIIQPKWFRDYFVYQLTLCALCLLTLLLRVFGVTTVYWPATTAAVCSVAAVATLFVFFGKRSVHELYKRMHF